MATQEVLTETQVKRLLELSALHGRMCNVKTYDKSIRSKPGRAILLRMYGRDKVVIKPFKHRREEIADISCIGLWKGGCDFDIGEIMNTAEISDNQQHVSTPKKSENFVIYSRKLGQVWCGENRRWTNKFHFASMWRSKSESEPCLKRVSNNPISDDAEIMTKEEAFSLFSTPTKNVTKPSFAPPLIPSNPLVFRESEILKANPIQQEPKLSNSPEISIQDLDLSAILACDPRDLLIASENRKKAALSVSQARAALQEATKDLVAAEAYFQDVLQKMNNSAGNKNPIISSENETKVKGKRKVYRNIARKILMEANHMTSDEFVAKIQELHPECETKTAKKCLYSMQSWGEAEFNKDQGWKITATGIENYSETED